MRALLIQKDVKHLYFYLRFQYSLRALLIQKKEFENNDIENAKKILSDLIQDTKDSIED